MDALVAAAIHDAKNALMSVDQQLDEIQRRPATADFSLPRAAIGRVAQQLSELLTLYRAQNGQLRLAIDDHDLANFLDDLVVELGPLPKHLTLKLAAWCATSPPAG